MTAAASLMVARSVLVPTAEQTLFLRSCLLRGEAQRLAFRRWIDAVGDPVEWFRQVPYGVRLLLPLLHDAVSESRLELELEPRVLSLLRAARLRESLRAQTFMKFLRGALKALDDAGVDAVLLKGAALAGTVYDEWALRHCHDIDLLIHWSERERARRALFGVGWKDAWPNGSPGSLRLVHASRLPIELHGRLLAPPFRELPESMVWQRSTLTPMLARSVRVLSPADQMVVLCARPLLAPKLDLVLGACDCRHLVMHSGELDWDIAVAGAVATQMQVPMLVLLRYVSEELSADVPPVVLRRLADAACDLEGPVGAAMLSQLWQRCPAPHRWWSTAPSWRDRTDLTRQILAVPKGDQFGGDLRLEIASAVAASFRETSRGTIARAAQLLGRQLR